MQELRKEKEDRVGMEYSLEEQDRNMTKQPTITRIRMELNRVQT